MLSGNPPMNISTLSSSSGTILVHSKINSWNLWITGAPHGEELGLINPLSESSCNCVDNSCILAGANRYGARATGGNPGKSSGKTFGNSRTIGTSSSRFSSDLSSALLDVTCA
nr:hypothetical protein [Tanacetum cinerariifolium]